MKLNGFGKDFGISKPQGGLRNDQNKETNAKSSTSKPQEKRDGYTISPEARARMGAESQSTNPYGRNVTEETPQGENHTATVLPTESSPTTLPNHGETLLQDLKLETAVEGETPYLTREQIEAGSVAKQGELLTSCPYYDLYGVLGPKQDIVGSFSGEYENNSWETTFPAHNPPSFSYSQEGFDDFMAYNLDTREEMTNAIQQALSKHGVVIPEGVEFDISVDPYDYQIHVTGVDGETLDPELEEQIELALNKGDNGKNLYEHINHVNLSFHMMNPDTIGDDVVTEKHYLSGQLTAWKNAYGEGGDKLAVMSFIEDYSGYGFDELEHRDGGWYTPDGENAWSLASRAFISSVPSGEMAHAGQILSYYGQSYQTLASGGFDAMDDRNLTITYSGGALYDYGTAQGIGEGQTEWVEEVRTEVIKYGDAVEEYMTDMLAQVAEFEAKQAVIKEEEAAARDAERIASNREILLDMFSKGFSNAKESILELMGKDTIIEALGEEEFIKIYGSTELTGTYLAAQERYLAVMDQYQINETLLDTFLGNDD